MGTKATKARITGQLLPRTSSSISGYKLLLVHEVEQLAKVVNMIVVYGIVIAVTLTAPEN
ncbi:MAG: hypothetical protein U5J63_13680 [Fodinibius sp.]|nr:hypothetical protein [Fodinibius sp.]